MEELGIGGAWLYAPRVWPDQRGLLPSYEACQARTRTLRG